MKYEEILCNMYSEIIANIATDKAEQLSKCIIRQLQSYKRDSNMMQSPSDSSLENLWDEICVQVQGEKSFCWNLYQDFVYKLCLQVLEKKCSELDLQILWLQTDAFEDWIDCECCDENELHQRFGTNLNIYSTEDVAEYLCNMVIGQAADYSNKRIELYLY